MRLEKRISEGLGPSATRHPRELPLCHDRFAAGSSSCRSLHFLLPFSRLAGHANCGKTSRGCFVALLQVFQKCESLSASGLLSNLL